MSLRLTGKQMAVLDLLRSDGEMTVKGVANALNRTMPCARCGATGEDCGKPCRRCDGRGTAWFMYCDAYQALKQLRAKGWVERRCQRDEWGDELTTHVYAVRANPDDPLEQIFALPAASGLPKRGEKPS